MNRWIVSKKVMFDRQIQVLMTIRTCAIHSLEDFVASFAVDFEET